MKVDVIERYQDFLDLREAWDRIYRADPEASIFLSWDWMSGWLRQLGGGWLILAPRSPHAPDGYAGLFPLRIRTREANKGGFFTELAMAGNRTADYTGFICGPGLEHAAIPAFASGIRSLAWAHLNLENVRVSDKSLEKLLACFPPDEFDTVPAAPQTDAAGIDNTVCPYASLPGTWEDYLSGLSANTRQKLRRLLRRFEADAELKITQLSQKNADRDIEAFIALWSRQWQHRKSPQAIEKLSHNLRTTLTGYASLGILHMPVFWAGGVPVAALAILVDRIKREMLFVAAGRDAAYDGTQAGLILHAGAIRHAIEQGYKRYDFLRGNEKYKYSFCADDRTICNSILRARGGARARSILDRRSIPDVLHECARLHAAKEFARAGAGYRQVLGIDPRCAPALHGHGWLELEQGNPASAEKAFRALARIDRHKGTLWLGLGHALAAQGHSASAQRAYDTACARDPSLAEACRGGPLQSHPDKPPPHARQRTA